MDARVHVVSAAHGVHPEHAARTRAELRPLQVRPRHGRTRGVRARFDHEALLPLDLCTGVREGQRAGQRDGSGGLAPPRAGQAEIAQARRGRPDAAVRLAAQASPVRPGRSLSAPVRGSGALSGRDRREGPGGRHDRRRIRVGADRRLLRPARAVRRAGRGAVQAGPGDPVRLSHRHGRAFRRTRVERADRAADRGEPPPDPGDPRCLRRAAAGRPGPDHGRPGRCVARPAAVRGPRSRPHASPRARARPKRAPRRRTRELGFERAGLDLRRGDAALPDRSPQERRAGGDAFLRVQKDRLGGDPVSTIPSSSGFAPPTE